MKKIIVLAVAILVIAGAAYAYSIYNAKPEISFKTIEVKKGDLLATIGATGTVEPEEVVDVGAQVAGLILSFGKDPHDPAKLVDYGTHVEEGTELAQIDKSLYEADLASQQATLDQANANVERANADLAQAQAKLVEASNNWDRAQRVGAAPKGPLTENDYEAYRSAFESAKANVSVAKAEIAQFTASVHAATASVDRSKRNLSYCTITSPVKGVVIDRRVNIGQTVVSSLNAPSLFLIAKDLNRMQVWAQVNEADVGNITPGQSVSFTVDAFNKQTFKGTVNKVRLNATMSQNVVLYTVEINTDNSDGRLLPYLTANVQFEVKREKDVLLVPNSALRWYPEEQLMAPGVKDTLPKLGGGGAGSAGAADAGGGGGGGRRGGAGRGQGAPAEGPPPSGENGAAAPGAGGRRGGGGQGQPGGRRRQAPAEMGMVWVEDGEGSVKPLQVKVGLSDGTNTEITGDDVKEGTKVVIGELRPEDTAQGTTNPFMPKIFNRRGGGGRRG